MYLSVTRLPHQHLKYVPVPMLPGSAACCNHMAWSQHVHSEIHPASQHMLRHLWIDTQRRPEQCMRPFPQHAHALQVYV